MQPQRILMTVDAVGGVWRYALDAARGLSRHGIGVVLVGSGPQPSAGQRAEVDALGEVDLVWLDEPLDWLAEEEAELSGFAARLNALAPRLGVDLLHLNMPSQAVGLDTGLPMVVVSHSCVVTWWHTVRGSDLPAAWEWKLRRNRAGFDHADQVLAPSRSHAEALVAAYGGIEGLTVVPNGSAPAKASAVGKQPIVLAAGRWWDEGKNADTLDEAASLCGWPVLMAGATQGPNGQRASIRHARVLGELSGAAVRERMAEAAIFAAPSLYEPFGLVALEAAHAGAALVLSDIPVFREIWDGAAIFAAPRDGHAFARAFDRLAADPDLRRDLARRAAARAREFSPERQSAALMKAYGRAMQRAPGKAARPPLAAE